MEIIKDCFMGYTEGSKNDNNNYNKCDKLTFIGSSLCPWDLLKFLTCISSFNSHLNSIIPLLEMSKLRHEEVKSKASSVSSRHKLQIQAVWLWIQPQASKGST